MINGVVIAAYYNMFVIIMAIFMLMGGVLLTALAYRPKEMAEEWWEWTERFYKSKNSRVVGPSLIVISVLLNLAALSYCLLKRHVKNIASVRDEENSSESNSGESLNGEIGNWQIEREGLLVPDSDIACFPDGSPRYVFITRTCFRLHCLCFRFLGRYLQPEIKELEISSTPEPSEEKILLETEVRPV